jgi:hypothetical protein
MDLKKKNPKKPKTHQKIVVHTLITAHWCVLPLPPGWPQQHVTSIGATAVNGHWPSLESVQLACHPAPIPVLVVRMTFGQVSVL